MLHFVVQAVMSTKLENLLQSVHCFRDSKRSGVEIITVITVPYSI